MSPHKRVFAVDDDDAVLNSLLAIMRWHGYDAQGFLTAEDFLRESPLHEPGCVVADLQLPGIDGLELQQQLLAAQSPLALVVVSGAANIAAAVKFMENGAVTLLEKPYPEEALVAAIEKALTGSYTAHRQREQQQSVQTRLAALEPDERTVLDLMLADEPNKQIAYRLDMSMRTIDRRRRSVLEKMGVQSVPELATLLSCVSK